jgi:DNA-binding CsgD family transcriptional regulator
VTADRADEALGAARAAFARADWAEAERLYDAALAEGERAEALDGRGQARWWLARREDGIADRRRAYVLHRRAGDLERAALLAVYLGGEARIDGNRAEANGWLARAERLTEEMPTAPAHGWLEVERAKRSPDPRMRRLHAERAVAIGREIDALDVEVMALGQLGLALVGEGRPDEGLRLLDEAMAAATGGEVEDPLAVGDTCCTTLVACARLDDLERAADWCRVVVDFAGRRNFTPLAGWCRAIYAGVLMTMGDWPRAEEHLLIALGAADTTSKPGRDLALAHLAELRLRQGRRDEAERLVTGNEDHPAALEAAVAVWLARDEDVLAAAAIERRAAAGLSEERPTLTLLGLRVALHRRDAEAARRAIADLRSLGETGGREQLLAAADAAEGRLAGWSGDGDRAVAALEAAAGRHARLGMPYEEALARLETAEALAEASPARAVLEAQAARDALERLGAGPAADRAAALLRRLGVRGRTAPQGAGGLTAREGEVLALLGAGLSNAEIAERLVISRKTAEHHVGRVLGKLGLRSRAEAAAHAVREGIGGASGRG